MADKKISALTAATTPLAGTEVLPIVQSSNTVKVSVANLTVGRDVTVGRLGIGAAPTQLLDVSGTSGIGRFTSTTGTTTANIGFTNTGGSFYIGLDSSTGGNFGAGNYGALLYNGANTPLVIFTNATKQFSFDTSGNLVPVNAAKGINFTANTPASGMTSQLLNWYEEGTWTPTLEGGTSNPTITSYTHRFGYYTRVGKMLYITFYIQVDAGNISGGSGDTKISGLPFSIPNTTPNISQSIPIGYNSMNGTDYLVGAGGGARWQVNGTPTTKLSNYTTGNGVWGTGAYYLGGSGVIMIV